MLKGLGVEMAQLALMHRVYVCRLDVLHCCKSTLWEKKKKSIKVSLAYLDELVVSVSGCSGAGQQNWCSTVSLLQQKRQVRKAVGWIDLKGKHVFQVVIGSVVGLPCANTLLCAHSRHHKRSWRSASWMLDYCNIALHNLPLIPG